MELFRSVSFAAMFVAGTGVGRFGPTRLSRRHRATDSSFDTTT